MKTNALQLKVDNYRGIHNACIDLEGMTILTGPSGSGKSTLLTFINQLLTCVIQYESLAQKETIRKMKIIERNLYRVLSTYESDSISGLMNNPNERDIPEIEWNKFLDTLQDIYDKEFPPIDESLKGKRLPSRKIYNQMGYYEKYSFKDIRETVCPDIKSNKLELPDLIRGIREYYAQLVAKQEVRIDTRPYDYVPEIFQYLYKEEMEDPDFTLSQNNQVIASNKLSTVGKIDAIREVYCIQRCYLACDFYYSSSYFSDHSWFEGERKKKTGVSRSKSSEEVRDLLRTILRGKLRGIRSFDHSVVYEREDGTILSIKECEPGLTTFLLLYRMLGKGLLTQNKLIIFDQPESFLGSDRIVQFARLVCLIQKRLGVKFLFATNLREMIEALQNAALEYELGQEFRLYESKEGKTAFQYDYHRLGNT